MTNDLSSALKLIARHYGGPKGYFAYESFEFINEAYFDNKLPWPLIVWQLTPYGGCLGSTLSRVDSEPIITLHPSTLGGVKENPWGVDSKLLGAAYALDVLIHELMHVSQHYILDGQKGETSHNCDNWIGEVNRLSPLLGFEDIRAERTMSKRVPIEGEFTRTGKPLTKVKKVTGGNIPHRQIASFPHSLRQRYNPDFYLHNELPPILSGIL